MTFIPFNRPAPVGNELTYMTEAVSNGHISGNGTFGKRCEALLKDYLGVSQVLLTTSCTHALEMSALLLRLTPGDEVIMPSFTFVSTANAYALYGARPVFVDIRPDTLNIDEAQVEAAITPRTKALVAMHYAGVGCQMDVLTRLAREHNLVLLEDNAHGLGGRWNGQHLGTFGALSTLSFHETKNFSSGEGGALVINDPEWIERAEILREKGTDRSKFFRGQVDKYTWVDVGSSYVISDILAGYLLGQLEQREHIMQTRAALCQRYAAALAKWEQAGCLRLPVTPAECDSAYHMFYLLLPTLARRDALIRHLKSRQILAVFHYVPLHLSPMGRALGYDERDCPHTQDLSVRLVRLPFYNTLTFTEQDRVIAAIDEFFETA